MALKLTLGDLVNQGQGHVSFCTLIPGEYDVHRAGVHYLLLDAYERHTTCHIMSLSLTLNAIERSRSRLRGV